MYLFTHFDNYTDIAHVISSLLLLGYSHSVYNGRKANTVVHISQNRLNVLYWRAIEGMLVA